MNDNKALVAFFSDSRSCRTIAEALTESLTLTYVVTKAEIKPERKRTWMTWFLLSLIPGTQVQLQPTETAVAEYQQICLVVPKWNLHCPPVTSYLRIVTGIAGKRVAIFLVHTAPIYRGYLKSLERTLERKGSNVNFSTDVRRQEVFDGTFMKKIGKFDLNLPIGSKV